MCVKPILLDRDKTTQRRVACGRCVDCYTDRSRQWALRLSKELLAHDEATFVTLTYSDENLPEQLSVRDLQLFMKLLRKNSDVKLRYYLTGEYSPSRHRPHYHGIIFGKRYENDEVFLYWKRGHCYCGEVNMKTIQYVSKYILKNESPGFQRPFALMSRRPGIGSNILDKITPNMYLNGAKVMVPRFYREHKKLSDDVKKKIDEDRKKRIDAVRKKYSQHIDYDSYVSRSDQVQQKTLDKLKFYSIIKSKVR